ncbi:uncharacterized protein [Epargyreus clarus]|uniref:uncharacterized protein n=1 Tax=Epargyreus clarus TaxID=520877 RepID=UPI003C2DC2AD
MSFNMMGMRLILVAALIISTTAIKVPVDKTDENRTETKNGTEEESPQEPIYYESDEDQVDSYLVPPNPYRPAEVISDEIADIATPATYLLPPSEDKQANYYRPTESGEQSDWYPIVPAASPLSRGLLPPRESDVIPIFRVANQSEPIFGTFRTGKVLDKKVIPVPSRSLQPPLEDAPNDYVAIMPEEAINFPFGNQRSPLQAAGFPVSVWNGPIISVPDNIRTKPLGQIPFNSRKYKNPTKLFPKKYAGFKPVPIPLTQFPDESYVEIPKAKPLKQFKPNKNIETQYKTPSDEKKIYQYEEAQKKRKLKGEPETITDEEPEIKEPEDEQPPEQETSASNYRVPLRNLYAAPLRQAPQPAPSHQAESHKPPADGERTEFRMHGMKGPHSYQFGFDTGKGKNRQFRYEERDNEGRVKGHYGYMDKNGKIRVVNYDADPEHGFRAEAPTESE